MNMIRMTMFSAVALLCAPDLSGGVAWPDDFWTQVEARVSATAPSSDRVATAELEMETLVPFRAASSVFGTVECPFSTLFPFHSDWFEAFLVSFGPGFRMTVR
jgi:hypothetical protein